MAEDQEGLTPEEVKWVRQEHRQYLERKRWRRDVWKSVATWMIVSMILGFVTLLYHGLGEWLKKILTGNPS